MMDNRRIPAAERRMMLVHAGIRKPVPSWTP